MILLNILIDLGLRILDVVWFFLRPVLYLYLAWFGMKLASLFH